MSQDSREQFEQAYSEDNGGVPVAWLVEDRMGASYRTLKVARAWYWWKRARAGVVVVLPNNLSAKYCLLPGFDDLAFSDDCREAIEAAVVKVVS